MIYDKISAQIAWLMVMCRHDSAMISQLNATKRLNIITIEDPIEHIHKSDKSLVIQREIGTNHYTSFYYIKIEIIK